MKNSKSVLLKCPKIATTANVIPLKKKNNTEENNINIVLDDKNVWKHCINIPEITKSVP